MIEGNYTLIDVVYVPGDPSKSEPPDLVRGSAEPKAIKSKLPTNHLSHCTVGSLIKPPRSLGTFPPEMAIANEPRLAMASADVLATKEERVSLSPSLAGKEMRIGAVGVLIVGVG